MSQLNRARRRVYVGNWFACAIATAYPITHNLNSAVIAVTVQFAPDSGGSPDLTKVLQMCLDYNDGYESGACVQEIAANGFSLQSGAWKVAWSLDVDGNAVWYASGHYRVIVEKLD